MTLIRILFAASVGAAGFWYFGLVMPPSLAFMTGAAVALIELVETRSPFARGAMGALRQTVLVTVPLMVWPGVDRLIGPFILLFPWVGPHPNAVAAVSAAGVSSCGVLVLGHDPATETTRLRAVLVALVIIGYVTLRAVPAGLAAMAAACLSIAVALGVVRYALVLPRWHRRALLGCIGVAVFMAAITAAKLSA